MEREQGREGERPREPQEGRERRNRQKRTNARMLQVSGGSSCEMGPDVRDAAAVDSRPPENPEHNYADVFPAVFRK